MAFLTPEICYLFVAALCCILGTIFLWISKIDVIQGTDDEVVPKWLTRSLFFITFIILATLYYREILYFIGIA